MPQLKSEIGCFMKPSKLGSDLSDTFQDTPQNGFMKQPVSNDYRYIDTDFRGGVLLNVPPKLFHDKACFKSLESFIH